MTFRKALSYFKSLCARSIFELLCYFLPLIIIVWTLVDLKNNHTMSTPTAAAENTEYFEQSKPLPEFEGYPTDVRHAILYAYNVSYQQLALVKK